MKPSSSGRLSPGLAEAIVDIASDITCERVDLRSFRQRHGRNGFGDKL